MRTVMDRDLFTTLRMLRADGLDAGARFDNGRLEVSLGKQVVVLETPDLRAAANWLAACAILNYPRSDFAKLWRVLARAAAAEVP